jgi:hypothetical protein
MNRIFLILITVALALGFGAITVVAAEFSDWSTPVNLGPPVNSIYADGCVAISKNGLSLFFSSNRQTRDPSSQNRDLYVSERDSIDEPWGLPMPLTMLNTPSWEACPALSLDEHLLFFTSLRPGGCGWHDIWVSRRHDRRDDFGWEAPVNLGCEKDGYVNTPAPELTPTFFEDEAGKVWMYFSSWRGSSLWDIYQSEMRDDNTFGPATPVSELNSPSGELGVTVRRDGLEVIFLSNRPSGSGSYNFWKATRVSTEDPWSEPVFVPSLGNPAWGDGRIALSFDGRELYFGSWRGGGLGAVDLWVARREKLGGKKK